MGQTDFAERDLVLHVLGRLARAPVLHYRATIMIFAIKLKVALTKQIVQLIYICEHLAHALLEDEATLRYPCLALCGSSRLL